MDFLGQYWGSIIIKLTWRNNVGKSSKLADESRPLVVVGLKLPKHSVEALRDAVFLVSLKRNKRD